MICEQKVMKMVAVAYNYAADRCYQASDRQIQTIYEIIISDLAKEKDLTLERMLEYQRMARILQDS